MVPILLLDCAQALEERLKAQGFDVESGFAGYCKRTRRLPSQVYEKTVIIYDPTDFGPASQDETPQYQLERYIEPTIKRGATVLVFANKFSDNLQLQRAAYEWVPYMPEIDFTNDKKIWRSRFSDYPDWHWKMLAPIVTEEIALPVLLKLKPPKPQEYPQDVFSLCWNGHGDSLAVLILRGQGRLIVLPRFQSNEEVIETFLHRVMPDFYEGSTRTGLVEKFESPEEKAAREEMNQLEALEKQIAERRAEARERLATAVRAKGGVIKADETSKQVLLYWDKATRQEDAALFYLYKAVEAIENKLGGEAAGIKAIGMSAEWKSVKRLANESYRDARHAPKPADVVRKWTTAEIRKCFEDTQKIILAYFLSLF